METKLFILLFKDFKVRNQKKDPWLLTVFNGLQL